MMIANILLNYSMGSSLCNTFESALLQSKGKIAVDNNRKRISLNGEKSVSTKMQNQWLFSIEQQFIKEAA